MGNADARRGAWSRADDCQRAYLMHSTGPMDLYGDAKGPPPLSRAGLVLGLYGAMALTAILISAGLGDPDLYRIEGTSTAGMLAL